MELIKHQEIEAVKTTTRNVYKIGSIVKINKGSIFLEKETLGVVTNIGIVSNGGKRYYEYSCTILDKNCFPINSYAWLDDREIELVSDDVEYGLKIIEFYKNKEK